MRNYSGVYKVQNPEKYKGKAHEVIYRSRWEMFAMKWCDENKDIVKWSSEEVVVPYIYEVDNKFHRYFLDLYVEYKNGDKVLIEIKPEKETKPPTGKKNTKRYISEGLTYVKNQNKWKAADRYAKKRGWTFVVWTENNLTDMGIMPKMFNKNLTKKKFKAIPKFKKPTKKGNK